MTYPQTNRIQQAYARATNQLRVSLLAVWVDKLSIAYSKNAKVMALHSVVHKSLLQCMEDCGAAQHQIKTQSAAAYRRALVEIKAVERVRIDQLGPKLHTPQAWATWWVALDAVAGDAWQTWATSRCWWWLGQGTQQLAQYLLEQAPNPSRAETTGAQLYLRAMAASGW